MLGVLGGLRKVSEIMPPWCDVGGNGDRCGVDFGAWRGKNGDSLVSDIAL